MTRRIAVLLVLAIAPCLAAGDEGMWTYDAFPAAEVAKRHGFEPSPAWLDAARLASARIADGCSASFVSPDGLVMTNHHCVHACVEELSTTGRDLVKDGFLAPTHADERRCPGMEIDQLLGITDVTAEVTRATAGTEGAALHAALAAERSRLEGGCQTDASLRCELVTLYRGGAYALHRYRRFQDVRLAFAPEFAVAYFGGDPDNFMFPRWDLDVAFVRVWDGARPARTEHHFRWSPAGPRDGQLTFVSGNPGKTGRLLTVAQLDELRDHVYPDALQRLSEERGLLTGYQLLGPEQRRHSTSRLFYTENGVKARRGMLAALQDRGFFAAKVREEEELRAAVGARHGDSRRWLSAWDDIAAAQVRWERLRVPYTWLEQLPTVSKTGGALFWAARHLVRAGDERSKPDGERLDELQDAALPELAAELLDDAPIHRQFETVRLAWWLSKVREHLGPDDPVVKRLLGAASPEELAARVVKGTRLVDPKVRRALWEGGAGAVARSADPMIALARLADADARALRTAYEDEVEAVERRGQELLSQARLAVYGPSRYPDATFTLRLSFGAVSGWTEGGRTVAPFTTVDGLWARATGRDPFALPPRWLAARPRLDPALPMNFVTTNDIVGGNSGSPVFDQELRIVGLVFDGNLPSLGGDFAFDLAVNRAVAVHSEAILRALDVVYGARRLVDELRPSGAPASAPAP
jgi:hypothetical protein